MCRKVAPRMAFFENASALCRLAARMAVQCRARVEREMEGTQETVLGRRMKTAPPLHAHSGRAPHQSSIDCPRPIDSKQACPAWQKNLAPSTDKAATRSQYVPDPQLPLRRCVLPLPGSMATSKAQAWGDGSSNEQQGCPCRSVAPGSQAKVRRDAFWAVATYLRGSQPAENSSLSGVCFISLPSLCFPSLNSLCH